MVVDLLRAMRVRVRVVRVTTDDGLGIHGLTDLRIQRWTSLLWHSTK